ncbi:MAG: glycosyltransferase, partial [Thermoflexus sp.]
MLKDRVKVLHLITSISVGGAELHLLTLCRHLKALGVDTMVAYLKEGRGSRPLRPDFEAAGIPVFCLGGDGVGLVRPWLRLHRLLNQEKPDILHTHLPRADLLGFLARTGGFSGSWVCSIHDIYTKSWRGRWVLPLFGPIWRRADRIIAISRAVREWLVHGFGLPSEKVHVVYYGIELERFQTPPQDLRRAWGLGNASIVGTVGRLEYRKGHDVLIRAMPFILRRIPEAILLIAGHDPWGYGRYLQDLVDRLELNGRVRLVGFQSDVCSFLHSLDVFAFASRSEGFGQVLIEAMAAAMRDVLLTDARPGL